MGAQPHVDAADVEQVLAAGQRPHRLPFLHGAQTNGALRAAPVVFATAAAFSLLDYDSIRMRREGGDGGGVEPHVGRIVVGGVVRIEAEEEAGAMPAEEDVADVEVEEDNEDNNGCQADDGGGQNPCVEVVAVLVLVVDKPLGGGNAVRHGGPVGGGYGGCGGARLLLLMLASLLQILT